MKNFKIIIFLLLFIVFLGLSQSCRTQKSSESSQKEQFYQKDFLRSAIRDSIFVYKADSIFIHQKNDTFFVEKYKNYFVTVTHHDTIIKNDTIFKDKEIIKKEVKTVETYKRHWYDNIFLAISITAFLYLIFIVVKKVIKTYLKIN
jgi:hypothetical protein